MGTTLTVTAKGQVTLRKDVLEHLGVAPGDKIEVDLIAPGRVEMRAARRSAGLGRFIGCLRDRDAPVLTLEEIEDIAHRGWAGEPDDPP